MRGETELIQVNFNCSKKDNCEENWTLFRFAVENGMDVAIVKLLNMYCKSRQIWRY
jgi:hypothetical protein